MSNSSSQAQPTLVIDCPSTRIRIHRRTFHLLGDTEYVKILNNPTARCIAFRSRIDKRAERIHWNAIGEKQCCEFYSKYLIRQIRKVLFDVDTKQAYRIMGQFVAREELVYFCADKAVSISNYEEELE